LFLPFLSGERTPHNDPYAQGVFHGITELTNRATLAYSVLEGVSCAIADGFDALRADNTAVTSLALIGGGARSSIWAQLIADSLGISVHRPRTADCSAALGAARLGWLAAGGKFSEVVRVPSSAQEFVPNDERTAALRPRLESYRALYKALRPIFPGRK
jgi:xylulokinase